MPDAEETAAGHGVGRDWVALILAIGLATAINLLVLAVLLNAWLRSRTTGAEPALSENATQILTSVFGGIVGVLGSYVGYRAGRAAAAGPPLEDGTRPAAVGGEGARRAGPPDGTASPASR